MSFLQIMMVGILSLIVLRKPYLGLVFTAASLPVVDLLPPISGFASLISVLGAITLVGFLFHRLGEREKPLFRFGSIHILGLIFIAWIYISNPHAAWFGLTRNWFFTFLQLWILIWLTGELLDSPDKHHVFMWVFSIATVTSALFSILRGRIGVDISSSWRDAGLADGANAAARYFVVAMLFLNYLRITVKTRLLRLITVIGMGITTLGVFFTVSRTGILLLFASLGLLFILSPKRKNQNQLVFVFIVVMSTFWFVSDRIINIIKTIVPSISQGTDTMGLRYGFWEAGWQMWLDHMVQGVGIGMYPTQLALYGQGLVPYAYLFKGLVAHNMYVQILAETGLIGFILFVLLLMISLANIWRARNASGVGNTDPLPNVWCIVFLVMLFGGMTKSDHIDKLIWLTMGVGVFFQNQIRVQTQRAVMYKNTRGVLA